MSAATTATPHAASVPLPGAGAAPAAAPSAVAASPAPAASAAERAAALRVKLDRARRAAPEDTVTVTIDGEAVPFLVRSMTAGERMALARTAFEDGDTARPIYEVLYPSVIIATLHDPETRARVFPTDDAEARAFLNGLPLEVVRDLAQAGLKVSAMTGEAADAAGNASGSTANAPSASPSPANSAAPSTSSTPA